MATTCTRFSKEQQNMKECLSKCTEKMDPREIIQLAPYLLHKMKYGNYSIEQITKLVSSMQRISYTSIPLGMKYIFFLFQWRFRIEAIFVLGRFHDNILGKIFEVDFMITSWADFLFQWRSRIEAIFVLGRFHDNILGRFSMNKIFGQKNITKSFLFCHRQLQNKPIK